MPQQDAKTAEMLFFGLKLRPHRDNNNAFEQDSGAQDAGMSLSG
jgi:hypothetical protein